MSYKINAANIKGWADAYSGELFDGVLCDPPYELGFMGKSWDSSGIAYDVEMWRGIFKLLKPGAHLLAFSGSRTYHRMTVAIEDAGFEIRDMIEWVYGSGFPKSLNIGKQGVVGYGGYGTALKPAHEPCVLARKPIEGTVANNALKHGVGGLNIDECRIEATSEKDLKEIRSERPSKTSNANEYSLNHGGLEGMDRSSRQHITGRFPANLIHDGSDEVEAVFPQNAKGMSGGGKHRQTYSKDGVIAGGGHDGNDSHIRNDSGSASRFFYTAKASKSERNAGLDGFEEKRGSTMATGEGGGTMLTGSGNERSTLRANHHPTVKPLALTKYLATLIKPPKGGRLLVPFSGSGSEMIGALQAGWDYVEGVELTQEYIPIAEARIKYWLDLIEEENKQLTII